MSKLINATIYKVEKNKYTSNSAIITLSLSSNLYNNEEINYFLEPSIQKYQFPLPEQILSNGIYISASEPFVVPGDPDENEIKNGVKIIARYWLSQINLPCDDLDIEINIIDNRPKNEIYTDTIVTNTTLVDAPTSDMSITDTTTTPADTNNNSSTDNLNGTP